MYNYGARITFNTHLNSHDVLLFASHQFVHIRNETIRKLLNLIMGTALVIF